MLKNSKTLLKTLAKFRFNSKTFTSKVKINGSKLIERELIKPNTYEIALVRRKDHDRVMQFLQNNYFVDEPLIQCLHLVGCKIEPQLYHLIEGFIQQGKANG